MNAPRLTDDRISQALREHLPDRAQPGLRERVLDTTETMAQQRALPSWLGGLDGDPTSRRRSVFLAAALLASLALATATAVGAWRLLHRDPIPPQLDLQPPADVPAYAASAVDRLPQLPPVAFTVLASDGTSDRVDVDASGAVRFERFAPADAGTPETSLLMSGDRVGRTVIVADKPVWIEQGGAIGEDPRTYLRAVTDLWSPGGSGCDLEADPSAPAPSAPVPAWRYVGADVVAGRATQHLACGGEDVWIDDATRLVLRNRVQDVDDSGNPIDGAFHTTEVTTIAFGDQPASLFAFAPPAGVEAMSEATYGALCPGDTVGLLDYSPCAGTAAAATPTSEPTPVPTPTPPPDPSACGIQPNGSREAAGPLAWTTASEQQDWPAPVRDERAGGASTAPMPPTYIDPSGDTGSSATSCVDIRDVTAGPKAMWFDLMSNPPIVAPSKAWIAYGVVVDEDRDGIPDWRYGIDNVPGGSADKGDVHRAWRTDLHTGRTDFKADAWPGREMDQVGDTSFGSAYPAFGPGGGFRFYYTADVAGGGEAIEGTKLDKPFYVWASMIVDGRVIATDYAPDTGWLIPPTDGANPGGTYVLPKGLGDVPFRVSMNVPEGYGHDGPGLAIRTVDRPSEWACDSSGHAIAPPVGPTVDDLLTFLGNQPRITITTQRDVMIAGYSGTYVEFTAKTDEDNCPEGVDWPFSDGPGSFTWFTQSWILDVDGVRLVIDGTSESGVAATKAENERIVDSIQIGP